MTEPLSALPSVRARVVAFASILVCGGLGGAIGYWFAQLTDESTVVSGLLMLLGTVVFALGAAVVSAISLRALGEWTSSPAGRGDEPTPVDQLLGAARRRR